LFLIICELKISLINSYNFNQLNKKVLIIGTEQQEEVCCLVQYLLSKKYTVCILDDGITKILLKKNNLKKICSREVNNTKFTYIFDFIKKKKFQQIYYFPKKFNNKKENKHQENILTNNLITLANVLETIRILNKQIKFVNIFYSIRKDYKSSNKKISVLESYMSYELIENYKEVFKLNIVNLKISHIIKI
jgi:hypothetical protein